MQPEKQILQALFLGHTIYRKETEFDFSERSTRDRLVMTLWENQSPSNDFSRQKNEKTEYETYI